MLYTERRHREHYVIDMLDTETQSGCGQVAILITPKMWDAVETLPRKKVYILRVRRVW